MNRNKVIQVFEHDVIYYGSTYSGVPFLQKHFDALAKLNTYHHDQYFTLVHKGIRFSQYVGVIQIDDLIVEILPKADKSATNKILWRNVLVQMLMETRHIRLSQIGEANLNKQSVHLLDIYFDWFLREIEVLLRQGLIKKYYPETKNVIALKGKLEFAGHISRNLIHKERFYTSHQVYERDHLLHQILNQALHIIAHLSKGNYLYARCKRVQLHFPEVSGIRCNAATFERLSLDRKSAPYRKALEIARLIILNYAPDISSGSERLLALLFDMNVLWEQYVLAQLKKASIETGYEIRGQESTRFWDAIRLRPDIVITHQGRTKIIIDTKWKLPADNRPSAEDLRQMYVYNEYWKADHSFLLYPATTKEEATQTKFWNATHSCGVLKLNIFNERGELDKEFGKRVLQKVGYERHALAIF